MTVTYWSGYSKRKNSTAQPTSGTDVTIKLKDDCSVVNPAFQTSTVPITANYFYIADFGRYYFLSNLVQISKDIWEFTLEVDVLATYKSQIGSLNTRIAFAATGWDKDIPDTRAAAKTTKVKYMRSKSTVLTSAGCYVLTVFNKYPTGSNGLGMSYVLEESEISKIKAWLGSGTVMQDIQDFFKGDPLESIFGCIWVPFPYASVPSVASFSTVWIGNQESGTINAKILSGTGIYNAPQISDLDIPYRYNDYRDSEPYTSLQIYLPGIGYTNINIGDWLDTAYLKVDYTMEYGTGDITYYLKDYNGYLIQTASANVASLCPLGQITGNGGGIITGVGGVVGGLGSMAIGLATGAAPMAIGGAAAAIAGASNIALSANKRAASLKGGSGGRSSTEIRDVILTGFYMDTEDVDNASYIAAHGRPVAVTHAISNHSGFVQCDMACVNIPGTAIEKERVNNYLNSGFFYE